VNSNKLQALSSFLIRVVCFCDQVVVTNPDVRGRQEILDLYLQDKPLGDDVDVRMLARGTPGFSGAGFILTLLATTVFIKLPLEVHFFLYMLLSRVVFRGFRVAEKYYIGGHIEFRKLRKLEICGHRLFQTL
jgi:hypothetical protein